MWWYNAIDISMYVDTDFVYGNLAWCSNDKDGNITSSFNIVENWFEMLDAWFDINNSIDGGYNRYRW